MATDSTHTSCTGKTQEILPCVATYISTFTISQLHITSLWSSLHRPCSKLGPLLRASAIWSINV